MTPEQQDPPFVDLSRENRIDAILEALEVVGDDDSTNRVGVRYQPSQFLLVESNVGSASAMQSHYLTTHNTLKYAGDYHVRQEYADDWQIEFAVDLDTGQRYEGEIAGVQWAAVPWETAR